MLDKTKPGLNHYELGRMSTLLVATVSSISCQNLIVNFMVFFCGGGEGGGGVKHNSVYVYGRKHYFERENDTTVTVCTLSFVHCIKHETG